jgi:uncharacterized membrane protein (DUF106 family)
MKTLFKPSLLKFAVAFILFIVFSWLWRMYIISTISDTFPLGFPLQFFLAWGPCRAGENCSEFNVLHLVLDGIFWYIVGAFLVSWFQKK